MEDDALQAQNQAELAAMLGERSTAAGEDVLQAQNEAAFADMLD